MDAILHTGLSKTGTTTIQKFLRENRDTLSRQGFFVPVSVMERDYFGQHVGLPAIAAARVGDLDTVKWLSRNLLDPGSDFGAMLEDLCGRFEREVRQAARHPVALLSSEGVGLLDRRGLAILRDLLSSLFDRITVLVYLRRQDRQSVSVFNSMVRTQNPTIDVFPDPPISYHRFDAVLDGYAEIFGRENIRVRLFEPRRMKDGDSLHDYMDVCGIAHDPAFVFPARQNESLNAKQTIFLQLLQQTIGVKKFPPMRLGAILGALESEETFMPARAEAEAYYRQFAEGNARVAREYFGSDEPLFDDDFSMYPESVRFEDHITLDDMAQAMMKHLQAERKARQRERKQKA